ncbi:MAG: ribonuclease H-like domain-containing protein [Ignavibacteriales bacterium]|nr:ribonuclease H-like domain-containing protein [Ignavibacteriales bacterium]
MNLVFDIETVSFGFETLSESQREFLLRYTEYEKDCQKKSELVDETMRYLSLYPYTAKIISLGLFNTETGKSMVFFEGGNDDEWIAEEKVIKYKPVDEKQMLSYFWKYADKAEKLISFNGRNFDLPFIMIRSVLNKVKPTKNYLKNRYDSTHHIDMLEQLTFYGLTKKFNLDFYCHAFGVESPKSKGITGMDVKELYRAGRMKDIAIYCGQDVKATFELYNIWDEYLNI